MGSADCENMIRGRGGFDGVGSALEDVGVDHGGFDVFMPNNSCTVRMRPRSVWSISRCRTLR